MPGSDKNNKNRSLLHLATNASVATASILITVKFAAWMATGSLSVLASLVDSFMDAAASVINLIAVRYSLKSADQDHQFGHGKAEPLAALAQASFITGSAIFLVMHAVERLSNPQPLTQTGVGIGVMIFALVATMILLVIQGHVVRRTESQAIRADSLHYKADLLANGGTVAALFLARAGMPLFDPLFALAIAAYIFYSSWHIGYEATQLLMDRELPDELRDRIYSIAVAHEQVQGVHDLRTRQSGQTKIIQLHLDLDGALPLAEAHQIAKTVERRILTSFPEADIIIHQDPRLPAG